MEGIVSNDELESFDDDTALEYYKVLNARYRHLMQIPEVREFEQVSTHLIRLYPMHESIRDYVSLKILQEEHPMQTPEELAEALRRIKERRELVQFSPTTSKPGTKQRTLRQATTFDAIVKGCSLIKKGGDETDG